MMTDIFLMVYPIFIGSFLLFCIAYILKFCYDFKKRQKKEGTKWTVFKLSGAIIIFLMLVELNFSQVVAPINQIHYEEPYNPKVEIEKPVLVDRMYKVEDLHE